MTVLTEQPVDASAVAEPAQPEQQWRPVPLVLATLLPGLALAALLGGVFDRWQLAVGLAALGSTTALLGLLPGRFAPYLPVPVGLVLAAGCSSLAGDADVPAALRAALTGSGLRSAPVALTPGWMALAVLFPSALGAAAVAAATGFRQARLLAAVPVPALLALTLLQPRGREVLAAVAFAAGTGLALQAAAAAESSALRVGRAAALRQTGRSVGLLAAASAAVVGLSATGILLPAAAGRNVTPPRRPPAVEPTQDRTLFTADRDIGTPWRVGVLDGYDGAGLLLPAIDPTTDSRYRGEPLPSLPHTDPAGAVTLTVRDLPGSIVPMPAGARRVQAGDLVRDPVTGLLRNELGRLPAGSSVTVELSAPPTATQLAAAGPAGQALAPYQQAPTPPAAVSALLVTAPAAPYERLQRLRTVLFANVVAAGAGSYLAVTPTRAAALLTKGATATPFEIAASEVLLARWSGVPARLAFGFVGGDKQGTGRVFRPVHALAYLEGWFDGYGWVALPGVPTQAQSSDSSAEKSTQAGAAASDELALTVFVPVRTDGVGSAYRTARLVVGGLLLALMGLGLLLAAVGPLLKGLRAHRRRRWVLRHPDPLRARVWLAYGALRDRATDLRIGTAGASPLQLVEQVHRDEEHTQLAWLVTRAMWGDLQRDLQERDAAEAERLAASVSRRLASAQRGLDRVAALLSRSSLRAPYCLALPGPWPAWQVRTRLLRAVPTRASALLALCAVLLAGCGGSAPQPLPAGDPVAQVPASLGGYVLVPEPDGARAYLAAGSKALVRDGRVWTLRQGAGRRGKVVGSVQVARFVADVDSRDRQLQLQVERGIGTAVTRHVATARLRVLTRAEQVVTLWFRPDVDLLVTVVVRKGLPDGPDLVRQLVEHQLGLV